MQRLEGASPAETAELTKTMIPQHSATSIIAQANATPQLTLALLT